jgi:hypothetical protein
LPHHQDVFSQGWWMARNTEDRLIEFQAAVNLSKIKASVGYLSPEDLDFLIPFVGMVRRSTRCVQADSRDCKQIAAQLKANQRDLRPGHRAVQFQSQLDRRDGAIFSHRPFMQKDNLKANVSPLNHAAFDRTPILRRQFVWHHDSQYFPITLKIECHEQPDLC